MKALKTELLELRKKIKDLETSKFDLQSTNRALIESEQRHIESENRYRMIFENANDGIIIHDAKGKIIDVNQNMFERLGYSKEEMLNMSLGDLVTPEYSKKIRKRVKKLEEEGVAIFVSEDRRKDGRVMPVEVSARIIVYDGQKVILSVVRDITERKMVENLILAALKEKEVFLTEIQNRVKDNMQIISSMLSIQSKGIKDKKIKAMFHESQDRIKSILFIHDRIYRSKNLSRIDFADFIRSLTNNLFSRQGSNILSIRLKREVEDIYLDIQKAIPCGMIIHELVSNSLKHGFPDDREGEILVKMRKDRKGKYVLIVKDNGIGLPEGIDFHKTNKIGLQMISSLVKQIEGKIEFMGKEGTTFTVTF